MAAETKKKINVLLIEQNSDDIQTIRNLLSEIDHLNFDLDSLTTVTQGLEAIVTNRYDVLLLDITLSDNQGLDIVRNFHEKNSNLPIVIITEDHDEKMGLRALQIGAQEYIYKKILDSVMLSRVILYSIERKKLEEQILFLAYYDQLTGLPNRFLFKDRLDTAITNAARYKRMVAVLFLDLDNFKLINDSLGHRMGDLLLKEAGARLMKCIRKGDIVYRNNTKTAVDTIARLGGDEFIIILTEIKTSEVAALVAERILNILNNPFVLGEDSVFITVSIGIAVYPGDGEDLDTLLKHADLAMYHAKKKGKNNYQYFRNQMNIVAMKRMSLENELRKALENKEFFLKYQPKMNLRTGELIGIEAQIRWQTHDKGVISPDDFIAFTEETNLIIPIGEWVVTEVCNQYNSWLDAGLKVLPISINISLKQFKQQNLINKIMSFLSQSNMPPDFLELEITESVFMDDEDDIIEKLKKINEYGCRILIDDFGVGYSSLNRLKKMPISALKIDKSFIDYISQNENDYNIVTGIIAMGHSLKLMIVAEGVETEEQLRILYNLNCDAIQGFILAQPLTGDETTQMIIAENKGRGIGQELIKRVLSL